MLIDMLNQTRRSAYEAACLADNMWSDELHRIYGNKAGDARYDKRGTATPTLAALCKIKKQADATWRLIAELHDDKIAA
jgi:hypothetical protein